MYEAGVVVGVGLYADVTWTWDAIRSNRSSMKIGEFLTCLIAGLHVGSGPRPILAFERLLRAQRAGLTIRENIGASPHNFDGCRASWSAASARMARDAAIWKWESYKHDPPA